MNRLLKHAFLILVCFFLLPVWVQAKDVQQELARQSTIEQVLRRGELRVDMSTFENQLHPAL